MENYSNDELLIAEYQIERGIDKVARQIFATRENISASPPIILGVLNGAFMFVSDLVKKLHIECYVDFCKVSSYIDTQKHELKMSCPPKLDVSGRDVYIIEDIVDTGETIHFLKKYLADHNAARIYVVSLIKRSSDTRNIIDFYGIEIDDEWIYGRGLDDNELRRNYRNIYAKRQQTN